MILCISWIIGSFKKNDLVVLFLSIKYWAVVYVIHTKNALLYRPDVWRMLLGGTIRILAMDAGFRVLMFQLKCLISSFRSHFWLLWLILLGLFLLGKLRLGLSGRILKDTSLRMNPSLSIRPFLWIRLKTLVCIVNRFLCCSLYLHFRCLHNSLLANSACIFAFCSIIHWILLILSPLLIAIFWIFCGTSTGWILFHLHLCLVMGTMLQDKFQI